jgi:U3 small nucleolar RNA-associated protein 13
VWAAEFSPVDQALITASGDKTIRMWSLAEGGACIRTFEGHQASVLRATFLSAGTQVRLVEWLVGSSTWFMYTSAARPAP